MEVEEDSYPKQNVLKPSGNLKVQQDCVNHKYLETWTESLKDNLNTIEESCHQHSQVPSDNVPLIGLDQVDVSGGIGWREIEVTNLSEVCNNSERINRFFCEDVDFLEVSSAISNGGLLKVKDSIYRDMLHTPSNCNKYILLQESFLRNYGEASSKLIGVAMVTDLLKSPCVVEENDNTSGFVYKQIRVAFLSLSRSGINSGTFPSNGKMESVLKEYIDPLKRNVVTAYVNNVYPWCVLEQSDCKSIEGNSTFDKRTVFAPPTQFTYDTKQQGQSLKSQSPISEPRSNQQYRHQQQFQTSQSFSSISPVEPSIQHQERPPEQQVLNQQQKPPQQQEQQHDGNKILDEPKSKPEGYLPPLLNLVHEDGTVNKQDWMKLEYQNIEMLMDNWMESVFIIVDIRLADLYIAIYYDGTLSIEEYLHNIINQFMGRKSVYLIFRKNADGNKLKTKPIVGIGKMLQKCENLKLNIAFLCASRPLYVGTPWSEEEMFTSGQEISFKEDIRILLDEYKMSLRLKKVKPLFGDIYPWSGNHDNVPVKADTQNKFLTSAMQPTPEEKPPKDDNRFIVSPKNCTKVSQNEIDPLSSNTRKTIMFQIPDKSKLITSPASCFLKNTTTIRLSQENISPASTAVIHPKTFNNQHGVDQCVNQSTNPNISRLDQPLPQTTQCEGQDQIPHYKKNTNFQNQSQSPPKNQKQLNHFISTEQLLQSKAQNKTSPKRSSPKAETDASARFANTAGGTPPRFAASGASARFANNARGTPPRFAAFTGNKKSPRSSSGSSSSRSASLEKTHYNFDRKYMIEESFLRSKYLPPVNGLYGHNKTFTTRAWHEIELHNLEQLIEKMSSNRLEFYLCDTTIQSLLQSFRDFLLEISCRNMENLVSQHRAKCYFVLRVTNPVSNEKVSVGIAFVQTTKGITKSKNKDRYFAEVSYLSLSIPGLKDLSGQSHFDGMEVYANVANNFIQQYKFRLNQLKVIPLFPKVFPWCPTPPTQKSSSTSLSKSFSSSSSLQQLDVSISEAPDEVFDEIPSRNSVVVDIDVETFAGHSFDSCFKEQDSKSGRITFEDIRKEIDITYIQGSPAHHIKHGPTTIKEFPSKKDKEAVEKNWQEKARKVAEHVMSPGKNKKSQQFQWKPLNRDHRTPSAEMTINARRGGGGRGRGRGFWLMEQAGQCVGFSNRRPGFV